MPSIGTFFFLPVYFLISLVILGVLSLLPAGRIRKIYTSSDRREEEKRIHAIRPFIRKGERLLDIGAGNGRFAKKVGESLDVEVVGVDVIDYSDGTIPFRIYDGENLPFPAKSFDAVFLAFVLHHTQDHEKVLREAIRVCRKKIIVFEDTYEWFWEKWFVLWNDYHTNILQGKIKAYKGFLKSDPSRMPMPYTFRTVSGWKGFFEKLSLKVESSSVRSMGYKPLKKVTFCLRV